MKNVLRINNVQVREDNVKFTIKLEILRQFIAMFVSNYCINYLFIVRPK